MTYSDVSSIHRWMGHVDGATRILEVRGESQLDSAEGLELFRHLRVGIVSTLIFIHVAMIPPQKKTPFESANLLT